MANLIITIDGPAGSGKSTIARLLAEKIGAGFLDTGAMYRTITLAAMHAKVDMHCEEELLKVLKNHNFKFTAEQGQTTAKIDGADVTEQIRNPKVTANVKHIASAPNLRGKLVKMQRDFAASQKKIVTEGRDQGTVAFKDADFKFFLTADLAERAKRRLAQLEITEEKTNLEKIQNAIEQRDKSDKSRAVGPLKPADDAIIVDTTNMNIDEVVAKLLSCIEKND